MGEVVFKLISYWLDRASVLLGFFVNVMGKVMEFTNTKTKGGLSFEEARAMEKSPELQMAYNKGRDAHYAANTSEVDTFRKSTEYLKYTKEQKEYFKKALNYTAPFEKMINEVSDIILGGVIKLPSLLSKAPVSTEKSDNIIKSAQNNLIGGKNDINSQIASVKGHSITNNFTIHEANNPQVTANLVEKVFQRHLNDTSTQIPTQNMGFARP